MFHTLVRRTACLVLCFAACRAQAQLPHVLGVWELNLDKSEIPAQLSIASETRRYSLRDDGYLVVLAVRAALNGTPEFIQIAAKTDGNDYPQYQSAPLADFQVNGTRTPLTYAETLVDDHTVEAVGKFNGQVINRATRRISADGKTMTLSATAYGAGGQEISFVLVFDRRSE
jgi:hypothetical protein